MESKIRKQDRRDTTRIFIVFVPKLAKNEGEKKCLFICVLVQLALVRKILSLTYQLSESLLQFRLI